MECKRNMAFADEMTRAQDYPFTLAKKSLLKGIKYGMDRATIALKFLERRQRDLGRVDIEEVGHPHRFEALIRLERAVERP